MASAERKKRQIRAAVAVVGAIAMKRVLVLGSEGLLGGAISRSLLRRGGVEILAPRSSELDPRSAEDTDNYFLAEEPDTVFHCAAAVSGLGGHAGRHFDILSTNVDGA